MALVLLKTIIVRALSPSTNPRFERMNLPVDSFQFEAAASDSNAIDLNGPTAPSALAQELLAANINPRTGLATDYLNHFNEAVMLLDMVSDMPECVDDFLDWYPLSYVEHFQISSFNARALAITTYETADENLRKGFDAVIASLTLVLKAAGDAMRHAKSQQESCADVAKQAVDRAKPLIVLAGGIINGAAEQVDVDGIMSD